VVQHNLPIRLRQHPVNTRRNRHPPRHLRVFDSVRHQLRCQVVVIAARVFRRPPQCQVPIRRSLYLHRRRKDIASRARINPHPARKFTLRPIHHLGDNLLHRRAYTVRHLRSRSLCPQHRSRQRNFARGHHRTLQKRTPRQCQGILLSTSKLSIHHHNGDTHLAVEMGALQVPSSHS
jgi:hypothetical protein